MAGSLDRLKAGDGAEGPGPRLGPGSAPSPAVALVSGASVPGASVSESLSAYSLNPCVGPSSSSSSSSQM